MDGTIPYSFDITDRVYTEHNGVELLTGLTVNGVRMEKVTVLSIGPPIDASFHVLLSEAEAFGTVGLDSVQVSDCNLQL